MGTFRRGSGPRSFEEAWRVPIAPAPYAPLPDLDVPDVVEAEVDAPAISMPSSTRSHVDAFGHFAEESAHDLLDNARSHTLDSGASDKNDRSWGGNTVGGRSQTSNTIDGRGYNGRGNHRAHVGGNTVGYSGTTHAGRDGFSRNDTVSVNGNSVTVGTDGVSINASDKSDHSFGGNTVGGRSQTGSTIDGNGFNSRGNHRAHVGGNTVGYSGTMHAGRDGFSRNDTVSVNGNSITVGTGGVSVNADAASSDIDSRADQGRNELSRLNTRARDVATHIEDRWRGGEQQERDRVGDGADVRDAIFTNLNKGAGSLRDIRDAVMGTGGGESNGEENAPPLTPAEVFNVIETQMTNPGGGDGGGDNPVDALLDAGANAADDAADAGRDAAEDAQNTGEDAAEGAGEVFNNVTNGGGGGGGGGWPW
jgi:hypothetical protein